MANSTEVIKGFASKRYPNEACGLIVKNGDRELVIECENTSSDPARFFMIDSEEYGRIADKYEVLAVWHSHVNIPPTPSEADRAACEGLGVPWYIISVHRQEDGSDLFSGPFVLEPSGFEMPYLERPYVFGVFDCYSLVRDYYKREFGIELSFGPRVDRFWEKGIDLFSDRWKSEGLIQMPPETQPIVGDLFLMQMSGKTVNNHVAVYIGNEMILHHCHNRLSRRDIYGGMWQKHTTLHLRHKTKC